METTEKLNLQIDKLLQDYELLKSKNQYLTIELEKLKNKNDELIRNNQDMLLKIDSTLTLTKARNGE
jgi:cell division protein ZapB